MKGFAPLAGLVGGASIVAGFKQAIDGASDLSESTSKVNVVFGEASQSVLDFADSAAKGLGQSEAQALEATGTFGNLLRSVGLAEEDAAKFSTTMVGLASDLASFNNTSVDDALLALRSGLVGETEPLKRFGVNLNDATLKAKALELGLSDGKATLDANAKAQAAYALIMEQTALAQGDFARTSDGLANQSKILGAQWTELTTTVGGKLLPATTSFVNFLNDDGLPALEAAGGLAVDATKAFGALPGPIKAAAGAFVALRIASATGLTAGLSTGVTRATGLIETMRLRTMLAADEFANARTVTRQFGDSSARVSSGVGRLSASMSALRVGAQGAGTAMARGLSGMIGLLGGPWGIALAAGTAVAAHFWAEQRAAKAHVEDLTASLNAQTGAITDNTEASVFNALDKAGAIQVARDFGIALGDVREAALGNKDALAQVNREIQAHIDGMDGVVAGDTQGAQAMQNTLDAADKLRGAIGGQNEAVRESIEGFRDQRAFMDDSAEATGELVSAMDLYKNAIRDTRSELQKLIDKEKERALNAIQNRRDQIALRETFKAAREEAAEGKRALFDNTKAADENMTALLDLADQWANSAGKVTNAQGAYEDMRQKFIRVAESMGATRGQARKLADELLKVPKTAPIEFQSKGYRERMREIAQIKAAMADLGSASLDFTPRGFGSPDGGGTLTRTTPRAPSRADVTPRAGVNIERMEVHGLSMDDALRDGQRRLQRRGLGGRP
jgi:hypothetical protein